MASDVLSELERIHRLLLAPNSAALTECEDVLGRVVNQLQAGAAPRQLAFSIRGALASITHLLENANHFYHLVFVSPLDSLAQYNPDGVLRLHSSPVNFVIEV